MNDLHDSVSATIGLTSSSLLRRVVSHDQEAWRRLVHLYGPLVDFWLRRARLQAADSRDVFQEVFRAVAQGIGGFSNDPPNGSFRGWLRTITRSKVADHFRTAQKEPQAIGGSDAYRQLRDLGAPDCGLDEADGAGGTDGIDEAEAVRQLRLRALELVRGEFEERTWQMFWRVTVDGHGTKDVAQELGVSPDAVRVAKWRVLRRLREELSDLES